MWAILYIRQDGLNYMSFLYSTVRELFLKGIALVNSTNKILVLLYCSISQNSITLKPPSQILQSRIHQYQSWLTAVLISTILQ